MEQGQDREKQELLTLKAVRLIRSCDMIAVPVSDSTLKEPCIWEEGMPYLDNCTAYQIVLPEVPEIQKSRCSAFRCR